MAPALLHPMVSWRRSEAVCTPAACAGILDASWGPGGVTHCLTGPKLDWAVPVLSGAQVIQETLVEGQ